MAIPIESSKSHFIAFSAIFAAMAAALDLILTPGFSSGIWDSWIFLLSPIVGVLLGPIGGFAAIGIGSLIGHILFFRDVFELLYMIGAPIGAAMAGLVYQRRWKPVLIIYSGLLAGYFLYPVSWTLPLFGIWDILVGFGFVVLFSVLVNRQWWNEMSREKDLLRLIFCTVIGLESDILTRVFLLVPGQTYWIFYGFTPEDLQLLWLGAGIITPIKVLLAVIMMVTIGYQVLRVLPSHIVQLSETQELESEV
ncbi:MAG: hypothetical protein ACFFED_07605 [Candidatus Thorarchaeota archaeon]